MSIAFNEENSMFHLTAGESSYVIKLTPEKDLLHLYWGRTLRDAALTCLYRPAVMAFSPNSHPENMDMTFDTLPMEYPFYGTGDFRMPAIEIGNPDGSHNTELKYSSHKIYPGKPALPGLPSTYVESDDEADTLEIEMIDELTKVKVILYYTAFSGYSAVARSAKIINEGSQSLALERAFSCSLDIIGDRYEMLQLSGSWGRERHEYRRKLVPGLQAVESRRGSSSHMQNPFIALASPEASEEQGEVMGFSLVYSGSFFAGVEVDQFGISRVGLGINPFNFSWQLEAGDCFQTPEAVIVYSAEGFGGMTRTFHGLYRERLARGKWRDRERPVLINNWEATYFDFNEEKLVSIADAAKDLGIELFVMDDGWFGKRDNDDSSLGDWFVDERKLPNGVKGLAEKINERGMDFGIWVEPEMVSVESELYREHPDWCLHVPRRRRTESRNQLVLDFSRTDVQDALIKMLSDVFSSAPITYVKWDMNRNMTEIWSQLLPANQQGEVAHRYILGLYRVMDALNEKFPDILFESCSGGGRFDPGMIYYMPQTWTSDDTDAVERLKIQWGTSFVYPAVSAAAHVSDVPNHQVQRSTSLLTRLYTAMSGNLGFEFDLSQLSDADKGMIAIHIGIYKQIRKLIQFGDFHRILSPFEENITSWMFTSPDKKEGALFYSRVLARPHEGPVIMKCRGLDPELDYRLENFDNLYQLLGYKEIYGGDELMYAGFRLPPMLGDFQSNLLRFRAV